MTSRAALAHLHPSPVGEILIVADGGSLVGLHPLHGPVEHELERLWRQLHSPVELGDPSPVVLDATAQLDAYFDGALRRFDLPLDWRLTRGFTTQALQAVCRIPYGETAGYGEVAALTSSPRAARAVGTACANTPFSIVVPVHRVVRADGSLGEYGGHPEIKRFLIDLEQDAGE